MHSVCRRFNLRLLMSFWMMVQALSTALIPVFPSIIAMCAMFAVQGVTLNITGIGKFLNF